MCHTTWMQAGDFHEITPKVDRQSTQIWSPNAGLILWELIMIRLIIPLTETSFYPTPQQYTQTVAL